MRPPTHPPSLIVIPIWTCAALALVSVLVPSAEAAVLQPRTTVAWELYIAVTEQRIAQGIEERVKDGESHIDERIAEGRLRRGDILVTQMETRRATGSAIEIPGGEVHHWRGHMFIAGVSLDDVLQGLTRPLRPQDLQEDVLESRQLRVDEHGSTVFLKLRRKKLVTVHYNTEHEVRYVRHDRRWASSRSVSTRIAELKDAGTPREQEHPVGQDQGFLWRLNSYWRYVEVAGGVMVECESVSLSRSIPGTVRWMVLPLVHRAARESMERTLRSLRDRMLT